MSNKFTPINFIGCVPDDFYAHSAKKLSGKRQTTITVEQIAECKRLYKTTTITKKELCVNFSCQDWEMRGHLKGLKKPYELTLYALRKNQTKKEENDER